jgi:hypothetical protein
MGSFIKPKISICETRIKPSKKGGWFCFLTCSVLGLMYVLTHPVCASNTRNHPSGSGFLTETNTSKNIRQRKLLIENRFAARANWQPRKKSGFFLLKRKWIGYSSPNCNGRF